MPNIVYLKCLVFRADFDENVSEIHEKLRIVVLSSIKFSRFPKLCVPIFVSDFDGKGQGGRPSNF